MGIRDISTVGEMATQIRTAIGVHGLWKQRINSAIQTGTSEWQPAKVAPHNLCDFGQWLDTVPANHRDNHFNNVAVVHADFHKEAARVLQLAISGKTDEATEAASRTSEYGKLTAKLTTSMMAWLKAIE
ncbi:MAG: CZB domain-containing protein [Zetaproteobacteria bacterium]|nr:CZB domain-containing protein [Zetaproteobacteria bacterium]